jgi:peptidoglycan/xylan/chitin deacetylase (PgdA/CDA1 family)
LLVNAVGLMYHDVVPIDHAEASGFPGGDSARYKLAPAHFNEHANALDEVVHHGSCRVARATAPWPTDACPVFLTFDDGGISGADVVAETLERRGWLGHFFITTAYIGRPGFMTPRHLRELHARGHVIGSHSHSHPLQMARRSRGQLQGEWMQSIARLQDTLGSPVTVASIPGGGYSRAVAETARDAGILQLFTSRPTVHCWHIGRLVAIGRFAMTRSSSPRHAADIVSGRGLARWSDALAWQLKQIAKRLGGSYYLAARDALLSGGQVSWGQEPR